MGSGTILREVMAAAELLKNDFGVTADVWSATSFNELRRDGMAAERWNLLHPTEPRAQELRRSLPRRPRRPGRRRHRLHAQLRRPGARDACRPPGRRYVVLGTDGFGRSDYRAKLRRFFEVDRHYVAVAALKALADDGTVKPAKVAEAIAKYGLDAERAAPWTV